MKVKAIQCNSCGDVVYSRANEDYRECGCGCVGASGGQQYPKFHAASRTPHKKIKIDVDTDLFNLYNDWKEMLDAYGLIPKSTRRAPTQYIVQ